MQWLIKGNAKLNIGDFAKDTFTGRMGKVLNFIEKGSEKLVAFYDFKSKRTEIILEARVMKAEKMRWLEKRKGDHV